jgi:hypothetical protein
MKTFKGNHNIESAFANFIEVVEAETGIKITDVSCYVHHPDNQQINNALAMEEIQVREDSIVITNNHQVWGLANISLNIFHYADQVKLMEPYKHKHDIKFLQVEEEEEEDPFVKCDICEEDIPKDEAHSHFDEPTCLSCAGKQIAEWEAEDQERNSNYYKDVL